MQILWNPQVYIKTQSCEVLNLYELFAINVRIHLLLYPSYNTFEWIYNTMRYSCKVFCMKLSSESLNVLALGVNSINMSFE